MKRFCRKCGKEYESSATPEEQLLSAIFGGGLCERCGRVFCKRCGKPIETGAEIYFGDEAYHITCLPYSN